MGSVHARKRSLAYRVPTHANVVGREPRTHGAKESGIAKEEASLPERVVARVEASALPLHLGSLCLAAVVLIRVNRSQWFYADEWSFLTYSRDALPWWNTFLAPHNEHWSTIPLLEYHILRHFIGIESYWPYIGVLILSHLVAAHIVWRTAVEVGVSRAIATGLVGAFAVVGAGSENLLWAFQIAFVGPLALGYCAALLVNHPGPPGVRDAIATVLLAVALMFSGIGLVMTGVVALIAFSRAGVGRAIVVSSLPASLYLAWRLSYPLDSLYAVSSVREFDDGVGPYVVRGFFGGLGRFLFDIPGIGGIATIALATFAILTAGRARTRAAPAYALSVGAVALLVVFAYGRLRLGIDQAASSRYSYLLIALLVPLGGLALSEVSAKRERLKVAILIALVGLATYNVQLLRSNAGREAGGEAVLRQTILGAAYVASDPQQAVFPGSVSEPTVSGALTADDLRRWARRGMLPSVPTPAKDDEMTAATYLQVSIKPVAAGRPRCKTIVPGDAARLDVVSAPGRLSFSSSGVVNLQVQLTDTPTKISGAPRGLTWRGGRAQLLVLRPAVVAYLAPQNRSIRVCR